MEIKKRRPVPSLLPLALALPMVLGLVLSLGLAGCGGGEKPSEGSLDIPETPPVSAENRWAVVQPAYQVLREQPRGDADSLLTLRRGDILEILSRSDWQEERKGFRGCWIRVEKEGQTGWIFEGNLRLYTLREQAENAAEQLR